MVDSLVELSATGLSSLYDLALLIARLLVGFMFAISGYYKIFRAKRRETMIETMQSADIPKPKKTGMFVAANELIFGLLLAFGLLTLLAATVLLIISAVAFFTVGYEPQKDRDAPFWWSMLLIKHQVLIAAILLLVIAGGSGDMALDAIFA